ncbi:hypothetical protein BS47DRAFT_1335329 [Hydnum rufescens UP504]|uniref:DUF202 domain-containing protein n=1 Tax=Hydnum rufescens UP504 TaxID=1448309 RepID=A0A9P6BBH0_9AGAM|nr:hypothetical protein BS47DRAFT_1335329 [Hydnum rufescens UP504]
MPDTFAMSSEELDSAGGSIQAPPRDKYRYRIPSWFPSPQYTLENSGSVARDHLANERTWLAYLRTSLALGSAGVVLVQLFNTSAANESGKAGLSSWHIQRFARPLGATTVAMGIMILCIGAYRYFKIQHALTIGRFPPARKSTALITCLVVAIIVVAFGVLLRAVSRQH